jgi:hypothetical protein
MIISRIMKNTVFWPSGPPNKQLVWREFAGEGPAKVRQTFCAQCENMFKTLKMQKR